MLFLSSIQKKHFLLALSLWALTGIGCGDLGPYACKNNGECDSSRVCSSTGSCILVCSDILEKGDGSEGSACSSDYDCDSQNCENTQEARTCTCAECICERGCTDAGACWPDCNPADNCCTATGTRKYCEHGCSSYNGNCYPECNPSMDWCCESNGTNCEFGCDGLNCFPDCHNPSDEVQQPGTYLYWLRCPLGQDWNVEKCSCTGTAITMEWCEAVILPDDDCIVQEPVIAEDLCESRLGAGYRLPTRDEFMDLLGNCSLDYDFYMCDSCAESTNCTVMFGSDDGSYWSSSSDDTNADSAWYASFNGYVLGNEKTIVHNIRCLR